MKSKTVEQQYRLFLLALSGLIFIGTNIELWFTEHTQSLLQLVPFVLCGIGLSVLIIVYFIPRKNTFQLLRIVMVVITLGGFFGIYEHVSHNLAFELEIRPNATFWEAFWESLRGASPLLAPGILSLAAVLALAAVYRHPSLISGSIDSSEAG